MQPYLWWTLYLEPPFCVRFGILHLITWLRWGSLFLFKIQSSKVFENWFFQLLARSWFWWQLVSIQNSTLKKYYKFDFSSFWHSLGFSGSFFPVKIQFKKVLKKFIFQLLARSWFWGQLFSAKKLQKNTKRIPPPNAAIPLVNPILRTSLLYQIWACPSDFDETGWNKRHDVLCFHEIFKNSTKKTKKYKNDSSSKCSHTLSEPYT